MNSSKDWKLFRVIYGFDGLKYIEGDWPKEYFEKALIKYPQDVGYIIGTPVNCGGHTCVVVELEGDKEVLEFVLILVRKMKENENRS